MYKSKNIKTQPGISLASRVARFMILPALLLIAYPHTARAENQDVIDYREAIMKQIDAETTALGLIVSGLIPPDSLGLEARSLANAAKAARKAFEPKVPGGEAKPEVWSKWDDFSKRLDAFSQKADEMAKAAEAGNMNAVTDVIPSLPCKECHDLYRNKKQ